MGYRRALLFRWSRRDRLAVLVVALTVAFLVGTTLVVLAAGTQTTAIAAEFGSTGHVTLYESPAIARAAARADDLVLPFAAATTPDGRSTVVLARPRRNGFASALGLAGYGVSAGTLDEPSRLELQGTSRPITVDATPRTGESAIPSTWYLAPERTVTKLGVTGALVVSPSPGTDGAPLRAALEFFVGGTRQALMALSVAGLGAAVLVGVTVFGVTRMSVRDRLETVRVIRATGGTPGTVLTLFVLRAGLLTAVGAALGYALGVILPNAAVSVAVASGESVSLPLAVTERAMWALAAVILGAVLVGMVAGALAAYPAAMRPPSRIGARRTPAAQAPKYDHFARIKTRLQPRLLGRRLVVPTAATLAAFVVFATVAAGIGTALGPVAAADASTVVEPDAPHPLASQVPEAYADGLVAAGQDASAEIILFEVVDGTPFIAFGATFDRFSAVHHARLVEGRSPDDPGEVVIGSSLASALDIGVGDRLALGGSTRKRLTVVRIVGRFDAPGATESQLVVPLVTARHLAGVRPGMVHLVSTDGLPEPRSSISVVGVVDVSVPDRVPANATAQIGLTLQNEGLEAETYTVHIRYRGDRYDRTVEIDSIEARTVTVNISVGSPGVDPIRIDGTGHELHAVEPDAISIDGLPGSAPPDAEPQLRVVTVGGHPVANATVAIGNRTGRTDRDGRTRVTFEDAGEVEIVATAGDQATSETINVATGTPRRLDTSLSVAPSNPIVLVQPRAEITLRNPWAVPIDRELTVVDGPSVFTQQVTVEPGGSRVFEFLLDRRAPGDYRLVLRSDGATVAEQRFTVSGDDRLASALASSGRTGQSGLSRAIEAALGNLRLVIAVIVGLAGLMTVGATTATFASGVQARARTLGVHRATGASPPRVLRLVLRDAIVLGGISTIIGLAVGLAAVYGLAEMDLLTVVGVQVPPVPSWPVVVGISGTTFGLTLLGATLATWGVLRSTPATLLSGRSTPNKRSEASRD